MYVCVCAYVYLCVCVLWHVKELAIRESVHNMRLGAMQFATVNCAARKMKNRKFVCGLMGMPD